MNIYAIKVLRDLARLAGYELFHIMFKPDCLLHSKEEELVAEIEQLGIAVVYRKKMKLSREQLDVVYFDFWRESARNLVFDYLSSHDTEQVLCLGKIGSRDLLDQSKGKTGSRSCGIRGRIVSWTRNLSNEEYFQWQQGLHPDQEAVDLEMYCMNLFHVPPTEDSSNANIELLF